MAQYIDKAAVVAEIEKKIANIKEYCLREGHDVKFDVVPEQLSHILSFINSLESKDVDLDKESMNYLLNEHKSPLTKVMHGVDLGTEMQYHKDIQDAFKAGFKKAMEDKQ